MASDLLGVSLTGLRVAQSNLLVVSNNVANVNTPGYSRQVAVQSTNLPSFSGAGYFGQGATIQSVQRVYNQFLGDQALQAASFADGFDKYDALVGSLLNRLGNPTAGINAALDGFYSAVQDFAVRPSEIGPRQAFLGAAQTLAARFRSFDEQIVQIRSGVTQEVEAATREINQQITSLAELNDRIVLATATAQGRPPNDLLDQRDQKLRELAQRLEISVVPQDDGALNVFMSNGQSLIVGGQKFQLGFESTADDPRGFRLSLTSPSGVSLGPVAEAQLRGGRLGALLDFARVPTQFDAQGQPSDLQGGGELWRAQSELGRIALAVSSSYNRVQQSGFDLDGAIGQALFTAGQPRVFANPANTVAAIPTVVRSPALFGLENDPRPVDYELESTAAGWRIRRLPDSGASAAPNWVTLTGAAPFEFEGLEITPPAAALPAGSKFLIAQGLGAAADMRVELSDPRGLAARSAIRGEAPATPPALPRALPDNLEIARFVSDVRGLSTPETVVVEFSVAGGVTSWTAGSLSGTITPAQLAQQPITLADSGSPSRWSLSLKGVPQNGDTISFDLAPQAVAQNAGPSDNRNAVAMGRLAVERLIDQGALAGTGFTLTDKYSSLISGLGTRGAELRIAKESRGEVLRLIDAEMQSFSGVNLDEEAAKLIKFQQAYGAAGRVLSTSSQLFQDFLASIR